MVFMREPKCRALVDGGAGGDAFGEEDDRCAAVGGIGGHDHALGDVLAFHHRAGGKVCNNADVLADEVFRLVPFCDAGENGALALAVKQGEFQQFFAFFHAEWMKTIALLPLAQSKWKFYFICVNMNFV